MRSCGLSDASKKFIDRWLDVTKSNLLFSRGVILVEGIAEAIVVPELARIVLKEYGEGRNTLEDFGVSVINLNGIYFNHFMQLFCDVDGEQESLNIPVRCAGLTDNDPPKSVETVEDAEGKKTAVPYLPHADNFMAGENHALKLVPLIAKSEHGRLFAGSYKTFEYDLALEGNNLARMFEAASSNWPTHGPVKNGLHARSELKFAEMGNQERANYAWELLERIDSDDMGKGLYAQILADELAANRESEFLVPDYIRDAVLWACELNK